MLSAEGLSSGRMCSMYKHMILFLAAYPAGAGLHAISREERSIRVELQMSSSRERFELVSRWAHQPLDRLRELRTLRPTVVHFSGHGGRAGLFLRGRNGHAREVLPQALADVFGAAGASVKLVVFSACLSDTLAEALLSYV